ncbi:hypothetical protein TNCV_123631 [Trichonephila clavipes]|nr:hypothetical protein TNCV_123631 [Trichonephila clavipes]
MYLGKQCRVQSAVSDTSAMMVDFKKVGENALRGIARPSETESGERKPRFPLLWFLQSTLPLSGSATNSLATFSREILHNPTSVSWGKLPTRSTQPTSRIETLTSTFARLKEDTCSKDSLAADQR